MQREQRQWSVFSEYTHKGNIMFDFFKKKNDDLDIELLRRKAKKNDKEAQRQLGLAYKKGNGVKKNLEKASYWLGKAYNNP